MPASIDPVADNANDRRRCLMPDRLDGNELVKDLAERHRARRSRALALKIEAARNDVLVTSLSVARDGGDARIELRSSLESIVSPWR